MIEDRTLRGTTLSGAEEFWRRINPRVMNFAFDYLSETEAYGDLYAFQRHVGFDREVFVIPDPDAFGDALHRRSFPGTIEQMSPLAQVAFGLVGTGYTIKERLA